MPRPNPGARLVLLKRKGFTQGIWYIRWYESGNKREISTGAGEHDREAADRELVEWLARRRMRPDSRSDPAEVLIGDVLDLYLE